MPGSSSRRGAALPGFLGLICLSAIAGVLMTLGVTPAVALVSAAGSGSINAFNDLPSNLDIQSLAQPTRIYVKNSDTGQYQLDTQFFDQNRIPVTWDQIAPVMIDAILSSEDPRFYQHGGIDLIGTARAILSNAEGNDVQGGSSISQQYVKNVLIQNCYATAKDDAGIKKCYNDATTAEGLSGIQRKVQEMRYAIALDQKYSKQDILLGYLNIANFGGTTYGIEAAAQRYFGVDAKNLNLSQASVLAGMVRSPNVYRIDIDTDDNNAKNGFAVTKERQTYVLDRMLADGKITQQQHDEAVKAPIVPNIQRPKTGCAASAAPYFCAYVKAVILKDPAFGATDADRANALAKGGMNIYTTLDMKLQAQAQEALSKYAPSSVPGMDFGAASVTVQPGTGRVLSLTQNTQFSEADGANSDPNYSSLVYAGDMEFGNSTGFNAGSTFKLFTLIDWLETGHSLNQIVNGVNRVFSPFTTCNGTVTNTTMIGNFEGQGFVGTPMQFTAQSVNSGYLAMASQLNLCDIAKVVARLGVQTADIKKGTMVPIQMLYPAEIIGSDNVSPMAMAEAYATVAAGGMYCQPKVIDKITDNNGKELPLPQRSCTQALQPNIAASAAYALQGVIRGGGTGAQAAPNDGTPTFGKTGTHEQWQTWMMQSSTAATTAVWVGNTDSINGQYGDLFTKRANGSYLSNLRYPISKAITRAADALYPGQALPAPDPALIKTVMANLPNVVGLSVADATTALQAAGFMVTVNPTPIDSTVGAGLVAAQDPNTPQAQSGSTVTLTASTGNPPQIPIPTVTGQPLANAISAIKAAGFANVSASTCTVDPTVPITAGKVATTTNPTGQTAATTPIAVYSKANNPAICQGP